MEDGSPSRTARMVAALRAQQPRIVSDSLAMEVAGIASSAEIDGDAPCE
jgi:hypothetical protein